MVDLLDFFRQPLGDFFIPIQTQDPIARGLVDGRVLLRGEAFPFFDEHFRAERLRNFNRAVCRARVDNDDLSLAVGYKRLHAGERASDVGLLVKSNNDDGKVHRWNAGSPVLKSIRGLEIVSQWLKPTYLGV